MRYIGFYKSFRVFASHFLFGHQSTIHLWIILLVSPAKTLYQHRRVLTAIISRFMVVKMQQIPKFKGLVCVRNTESIVFRESNCLVKIRVWKFIFVKNYPALILITRIFQIAQTNRFTDETHSAET
jgi:hypothetical protein